MKGRHVYTQNCFRCTLKQKNYIQTSERDTNGRGYSIVYGVVYFCDLFCYSLDFFGYFASSNPPYQNRVVAIFTLHLFTSLYKSAIFNSHICKRKNGDNSFLVGEGLKMQNSQQNQTVARKLAKEPYFRHSAIHYNPDTTRNFLQY